MRNVTLDSFAAFAQEPVPVAVAAYTPDTTVSPTTAQQVNVAYLRQVNARVAKIAVARARYGDAFVEHNLLPQHEQDMQALNDWRESALIGLNVRPLGSFGAPPAPAMGGSAAQGVVLLAIAQSGMYPTGAPAGVPMGNSQQKKVFANTPKATQQLWLGYAQQQLETGMTPAAAASAVAEYIMTGGASAEVGQQASATTAGQLADIQTQYNAAVATINQQVSAAQAAAQSQYQQIVSTINSYITQAQQAGNTALVTQYQNLLAQAQIAYQADLANIAQAQAQAMAAAAAWQTQAQQSIASQLTNTLGNIQVNLNVQPAANLDALNVPGVTPVSSTTTTSPALTYTAADGTVYDYVESTGQYEAVSGPGAVNAAIAAAPVTSTSPETYTAADGTVYTYDPASGQYVAISGPGYDVQQSNAATETATGNGSEPTFDNEETPASQGQLPADYNMFAPASPAAAPATSPVAAPAAVPAAAPLLGLGALLMFL